MRRYHIGLPFLVYCGLTVLVALAAMNEGHNLLFWVFGVMAAGLLLSGLVSGSMMMGLEARRITPGHGEVGEPLVVRYVVRNRNRLLPAFDLHLEERPGRDRGAWNTFMAPAPAWIMHVGPREELHGEAWFRPSRRGAVAFDGLRISTSFPFGILRKSITVRLPQQTLVYPRLYPLRRHVLGALAPDGPLGMRVSPHAGAGDDFFGLREYKPGDSMRHIAWKRTANRDELVSVERTRPDPPRLRVILDLATPTTRLQAAMRGPDAPDARDLEERAISLAASIVHVADLAGYEVGLAILGIAHGPIQVRRGHWHRNRMMAALAGIDLDAARDDPAPFVAPVLEHAGLVVVHPGAVDPSVVRGEALHFTARHLDRLVEPGTATAPRLDPPADGARGAEPARGEAAA